LDPAPISLKDGKNDSPTTASLGDIINKQSPDSNNNLKIAKRQLFPSTDQKTPEAELRSNIQQKYQYQPVVPSPSQQIQNVAHTNATQIASNDISPTNIPSLDIADDWTSDMLWKDVDSVMNDFGFNIDDLAKTPSGIIPEGTFAIPPQQPGSLPPGYNPHQSLFGPKQ
jgi:transcriptional regulatory protein LEU3